MTNSVGKDLDPAIDVCFLPVKVLTSIASLMGKNMVDNPVGQHVLLDLHDCECEYDVLGNELEGLKVFHEVQKHFNVLNTCSHQFTPSGYSVVLLLAESHITVHTWPERRFCSLDLYTCSGRIPEEVIVFLREIYRPKRFTQVVVARGVQRPEIAVTEEYGNESRSTPDASQSDARRISQAV